MFSHTNGKSKVKVWAMPTEVYSRIVGYYRPVQNWNKGKKQEFKERKYAAVQTGLRNKNKKKAA